MSIAIKDNTNEDASTGAVKHMPIIVMYSPDIDFCVSLRFLFQDQYQVITTTDPDMLLLTVREFQPDVVIVDSLPTEKMRHRFTIMKRENPRLRIISFYVSHFVDRKAHEYIRNSVDVALSKPLDLAEVTTSINELMAQGSTYYVQRC